MRIIHNDGGQELANNLEESAPILLAETDAAAINGLLSAISLIERTSPAAAEPIDYLKKVATSRIIRVNAYHTGLYLDARLEKKPKTDVERAIDRILGGEDGTK